MQRNGAYERCVCRKRREIKDGGWKMRDCLGLDGTGGSNALLGELALVEADDLGRGSLGHLGSGLAEEDLGVDGVTLVRVDATVGTVRAAAGLGGLLDHNVADDKLLGLEALGLSVGLSVLEEGKEELDRLDGPSTWLRCECKEWKDRVSNSP